jgi:DNA-binding transcriptional MocR family regulator
MRCACDAGVGHRRACCSPPDATRRDRGFSKTETPNWRVGFFAASGLVERLHDQGWLLAPGEPREAMRNPMK